MRSGKADKLPRNNRLVSWTHAPRDTDNGCSLRAVLSVHPPSGATGFSVLATFQGRPSALNFDIMEKFLRVADGEYRLGGSANFLIRGPKNEMVSLGGPQLLSKETHSAHFNIVLLYLSKSLYASEQI